MMDDKKLHDECGVFGIYSDADDQNVASSAYLALYALQHRGQMSCGIAVGDHGIIKSHSVSICFYKCRICISTANFSPWRNCIVRSSPPV